MNINSRFTISVCRITKILKTTIFLSIIIATHLVYAVTPNVISCPKTSSVYAPKTDGKVVGDFRYLNNKRQAKSFKEARLINGKRLACYYKDYWGSPIKVETRYYMSYVTCTAADGFARNRCTKSKPGDCTAVCLY